MEQRKFKIGDSVIVSDEVLSEYSLVSKYSGKPVKIIEPTEETPQGCYNVDIPHNRIGGLNVRGSELTLVVEDKLTTVTNEQLGAVYLKKEGLDVERFKRLVKGMQDVNSLNAELSWDLEFIEYWRNCGAPYRWIATHTPEEDSKLITLDELEELLFPTEFVLPEKWCIRQNTSSEVCDWFNSQFGEVGTASIGGGFKYLSYDNGNPKYSSNVFGLEITFEQFKKYVLKTNNKEMEKQTNTYPVTREQLQSIWDIAYQSWKTRIEKLTNETLGAFGTEGVLTEEVVQSMRDAATESQRPVIDRIFPMPKRLVKKSVVKYDRFDGQDFKSVGFYDMSENADEVTLTEDYPYKAKITVEYEVEE